MTKKEEILYEKLKYIVQINALAKEYFLYSEYLLNPETDNEREYIGKSSHFVFIRQVFWRTSIIEISKLFRLSKGKDRDKYNLNDFIQSLLHNGYHGDCGIEARKVQYWLTILDENKKVIDSLLTLRDSVYAHTDPTKWDNDVAKLSTIDYMSLAKLFDFTELVLKDIYHTVFDTYLDTSPFIFDRKNFDIVKILAEEKNQRIQRLIN